MGLKGLFKYKIRKESEHFCLSLLAVVIWEELNPSCISVSKTIIIWHFKDIKNER